MQVNIYSRQEINPGQWDEFMRQSPEYIIYGLSGYLDCVCEGWNAIIATHGNRWMAVMPLNIGKKYLINYSLKPPFVQYLGIFFAANEKLTHSQTNFKKRLVESIIENIPQNIKLFNHNFNPQFNHFMPFAWKGFSIKPFHTYWIHIDRPVEEIYNNFSGSVRKFIRKSETSLLRIDESDSITWIAQTMQRRNIISRKGVEQFERLWQFIMKEEKGFVLYVTNKDNGQVHCGGAFLIDGDRLILLATGIDLKFKKTRAKTLMLWFAIQRAHQLEGIRIFDFMGSMIRGVVNYIHSFGAEPVMYFNISRSRLLLPYSLAFTIKERIMARKINQARERLTRMATG